MTSEQPNLTKKVIESIIDKALRKADDLCLLNLNITHAEEDLKDILLQEFGYKKELVTISTETFFRLKDIYKPNVALIDDHTLTINLFSIVDIQELINQELISTEAIQKLEKYVEEFIVKSIPSTYYKISKELMYSAVEPDLTKKATFILEQGISEYDCNNYRSFKDSFMLSLYKDGFISNTVD